MPLPAVLAAVAAAAIVVKAVYDALPDSVHTITREQFEDVGKPIAKAWAQRALTVQLQEIGIELDIENEGITPYSITQAINKGPLDGTGIVLTNVFDKEACKKDMMRIALMQAANAVGIEVADPTVEGIKAAIKADITRQITEQIGEGAGPWLDACPDLVQLARQLDAARRSGLIDGAGNLVEPGLFNDEEHVKARERQARYQKRHKRRWVTKGE